MATTIDTADLTVTITESIELNGKDKGGSNTIAIGSVATISKRIIDVPASEVEIIAMSTAVASGTFIEGDLSGGVVDTMHAGGSALTVSLNDLVNITALADTAACDVEVFIASA